MEIRGRAWKYGDNVNTDVLFPGKYTYTAKGREEIAGHALEDLDPAFAANVRAGDLIVGGRNFGCGSSREQARDLPGLQRRWRGDRRELRPHLLPQRHQQRPSGDRLPGSGAGDSRRRDGCG